MRNKDITIIAIFTALLLIQEEILSILPNINLTFFLLLLYSKKLGTYKTSLIIIIYCLIDNLIMNSINNIYIIFMLIGLLIIPILTNTVFNKCDSTLLLSFISVLFSLIYCWVFIIPSVFIYKIDLITYVLNDVVFELLLAVSSFVCTLLLYKPCSKMFDYYLR